MRDISLHLAAAVFALSTIVVTGAAQDLTSTLEHVSRQVEGYFTRARAILCTERVVLQPLGNDLSYDGFARRLEYEVRVEWEPPADGKVASGSGARISRRLLTVNGRRPKPEDERCTDPKLELAEPLSMFLPERRNEFTFALSGTSRIDGRTAVLLDYQDASGKPADIKWDGDCVSIDVPQKTRGRAWIDADTGDVLRIDERFAGLFDVPVPRARQRAGTPSYLTVERSDTTIRYKPVSFSDPDETLLLPSTIETLSIVRNAGTPRLKMTQTFSGYKRFVTNSRIIQ